MQNSVSNRTIVKNTGLLYVRQLFTLGLSLYTSRLTLQVLGVSDYGIYAAVGGITALLSILTTSMSTSTQRFMTFELGTGNKEKLNKVYITSFQIHSFLALLILILGETIGLWFLKHKLTIPIDRLDVAIYVFQLSLFNSLLNILNVPNQAAIIAREDMGVFAIFSIADAVLKLAAVILLFYISWDKLLGYAIFLFLIQFLNRTISIIYCRIKYAEIRYRNLIDKSLLKEMFSLAGWNIISNLSIMGFIQGVNILLNIFFGPVLNAAYTVAMQAYSGIRSFTSSFQLASNPQIIKSYSTGDLERMHSLLLSVCKMSFFLIFFLSLPFLINAEAVLKLWLGEVPDHATTFFVLLLLYAYLDVFSYPLDVAAQATGNVKTYNTLISIATILTLPISYFFYVMGTIPEIIYIVAITMSVIGLFVRVFKLSRMIHLKKMLFFKEVIAKSFIVGVLSSIIPLVTFQFIREGTFQLVITFILAFISTGISIYYLGLSLKERIILKEYWNKLTIKLIK